MSLFLSLLLQTIVIIFVIVVVFEICGKLFIKDGQADMPDEVSQEEKRGG
jgi:hypothetical protein